MKRNRMRQWATALVVACIFTMLGLSAATSSQAAQFTWINEGSVAATTTDAGDSRVQLRVSAVRGDSGAHKIQVAAHYAGGWTPYGSWVEGWGSACHSYAGTTDAGGMVYNPHSVAQNPVLAFIRYSEAGTC